jgi:hypothetical protein
LHRRAAHGHAGRGPLLCGLAARGRPHARATAVWHRLRRQHWRRVGRCSGADGLGAVVRGWTTQGEHGGASPMRGGRGRRRGRLRLRREAALWPLARVTATTSLPTTCAENGREWGGRGRRTKQRWRRLTVDEVDSGFAGAALKMNTSVVDGDLREEEEEVELRSMAREMRRRGGSYRGERRWRRSDRPDRDAGIL